MTIHVGDSTKLNTLMGVSSIMEVGTLDAIMQNKVLPKNIIIKDTTTGNICLTDGTHNLKYVIEHPLLDGELEDRDIDDLCDYYLT